MNKYLALAAASLLFSLPSQAQKTSLKKTASGRGVIFPAPLSRDFSNQCSRRSPVGWWTTVAPSLDETKRLETALPQWMKAHPRPRWEGRFDAYNYQYGAIVRDGKRLIYINALPAYAAQYDGNSWLREPQVACDGGADFWGAEFDPKVGKFQNASFNGVA